MSDFQELAAEAALRSELGRTADFHKYDREGRTPMNFVLDAVERQIGRRFTVYWVDGGPPDVFCLPGFTPSPVVFSTRYLSLTAFVRKLLISDWMSNIRDDVAERTTLKVMAEMALRRGDPDYAVLAFVKSVVGKGIWISDEDQIMSLEYEPIQEHYMASWFYGLVHELGHLYPTETQQLLAEKMFPDAVMLEAITHALSFFPSFPDFIKQEALERARQRRSTSVLGIDLVRSEGLADIFAASTLFQTTSDIMSEINKADSSQKRFEVVQFIGEMVVFLNIIAIIERCRRVALLASMTEPGRDEALENLLHPVSVVVRALMQRQYLEIAVARYAFGDDPAPEDNQRISNLFNDINEHYRETINKVEAGTARAMEFSLFPDRRENEWKMLEAFRSEIPKSTPALLEAKRFCELADSLGVDGKLLQALKDILADPSKHLNPDPRGDLIYFIPWVEGPDGFNRPFGLNTKHGHLVFVFLQQGELYESFFGSSAETLLLGFTLKRAILPVPRKERLGPELAARMPGGQHFRIIVEGTEEFSQYMKELADDTIWED
jgi:hypothetical protein